MNFEFLPPGQTVKKEHHLNVKRHLRENIRLKRPKLWQHNSWFLHHDNPLSHTALILRNLFPKNSIHIVLQPPLLATQKIQKTAPGTQFWVDRRESKWQLKAVSEIDLNNFFEDWKIYWHKSIVSGGGSGYNFDAAEIDLEA